MFNWLSQVGSVLHVNLRSIVERKAAVLAAAVGIAGVVGVFVGVLSIAEGFHAAMKVTGAQDVAVVLRNSADTEMTSGLSREETRLITDAPGIARNAAGPLASAELFVIINLPKRSTGLDANVPFRGAGIAALAVRGDVKIVQGRIWEPGRNEVIVGVGAARAFGGLEVGKKISIGQNDWEVVGVFSGGGGAAESEIWTDAAVLQPAYHRGDSFQSVYVKLTSPAAFDQLKDSLTTNPQLKVKVVRQADFLADQSAMLTKFIRTIGFFIAAMMALGAIFGALNTMYSAVSARTREIATLRALGFGAGPVVLSILLESLAMALVGGAVGGAAAYLAFNDFKTSTINWQTFSQIAFAFSVTPALLVSGLIWALFIGLIGGLFPAIRAARMPIAAALREL
ncbi:MAG: putative transport system permease protein [Verrucomicrobiota bacterium]